MNPYSSVCEIQIQWIHTHQCVKWFERSLLLQTGCSGAAFIIIWNGRAMGVLFLVFIFFEVECMALKRIKTAGNSSAGTSSTAQRPTIILSSESYITISNLHNESWTVDKCRVKSQNRQVNCDVLQIVSKGKGKHIKAKVDRKLPMSEQPAVLDSEETDSYSQDSSSYKYIPTSSQCQLPENGGGDTAGSLSQYLKSLVTTSLLKRSKSSENRRYAQSRCGLHKLLFWICKPVCDQSLTHSSGFVATNSQAQIQKLYLSVQNHLRLH